MSRTRSRTSWTLTSDGGLTATVADGGGLESLGTPDLELVQHAATALEPGLLRLWVRDLTSGVSHAVLGPGSGSRVQVVDGALSVSGGADGLRWTACLRLDGTTTAWSWHVAVSAGDAPRRVDVVHGHDVALSGRGALSANELYVSQYLDVTPVQGPWGTALAVRQNQPQAGGVHPWCVLACDRPVAGWATDALDVLPLLDGAVQGLPSRRLQHEHTLVTLAAEAVDLAAGRTTEVIFAGLLLDDHPAATGPQDGEHARTALRLAAAALGRAASEAHGPADAPADGPGVPCVPGHPSPHSLYSPASTLPVHPVAEALLAQQFPGTWRAVERDAEGAVLSFFTASGTHVVTAAKEAAVLRPHGTILRTGATARPDPAGLTVTAWMSGSPLSYLTRGHATEGRVLTTVRGYLGLHRAYGVRVFVEEQGAWLLLERPSVFAMDLDAAAWTYAWDGGTIGLRTQVPAGEHVAHLTITSDVPRRVLLALHGVGEGPQVVTDTPVTDGDDAVLFADGRSRGTGTRTLLSEPVEHLALRLAVGDGGPAAGDGDAWWPAVTAVAVEPSGHGTPEHVTAADTLAVALPWLVRDGFVHFLSPRGLEQFTGGAWGTRDVAQGPLELLLALDRLDDARALVLRILAAQNEDGSWPQAFGFLAGDSMRTEPPHGDVVHWPILAVGRYLLASGDASVLDEPVGWFGGSRPTTALDHVERATAHARSGFLPGTHLVAYGHGDWNDSLQPADPAMARTLTSTWTVVLHRQALLTLADGLDVAGAHAGLAKDLRGEADAVTHDLRTHLLVDGELAGYAVVEHGRAERHLVHPRDVETGLTRGSLQSIHALGDDLLTPEEADHHVGLVREHLTGVDGVRLFDRPAAYSGGLTRHFRRAETATFVGREIGLMYAHAHLRWCEALAHRGDAEELWHAVQQVLPAAHGVVPGARARQANTYSSSSDAAVSDRAEFAARYAEVLTGATGLEGGWRIYSSGPGVLVRVVVQSLLGVRRRADLVELDPVLPAAADGLLARVPLAGGVLPVRFRVGPRGHGPVSVRLAGRDLPAERLDNPYRTGGLVLPISALPIGDLPISALPIAPLGGTSRPDGAELEIVLP